MRIIRSLKGIRIMKRILLYNHGGSSNHGCEALVRTVAGITKEHYPDAVFDVSSNAPDEDIKYIGENQGFNFFWADKLTKMSFELKNNYTGATSLYTGNIPFFKFLYKKTCDAAKAADLMISVGGDTYSYGKSSALTVIDRKLRTMCPVSVLWGCSINPGFLDPALHSKKIDGLRQFDLITARESITYDTLRKLGFDNVELYPDPAFTLPVGKVEKPMFDNDRDIVGINLSPLIQGYEQKGKMTLRCYAALVRRILDTTDFNVAFISHVRCAAGDDSRSAKQLMAEVLDGKPSDRVALFDRGNAVDIKGYISKCRFLICARTHASIAAYSQCIPTLVVGYSVKATGIAKDLFGTDEGYVLPVQSLAEESQLCSAFDDMLRREDKMRSRLESIMPDYVKRAHGAGDALARLISGSEQKEAAFVG